LFGAATSERNRPTAKVDRVFRSFDPRGRKIERHGLGVAVNEIEDPMAARIHACNKVGPRHRTLWWNASRELAEISLGLQFRKVGHLGFGHEPVQELRIHAVDAQNDQALIPAPIRALGAAGRQYRHRGQEQGSVECLGNVIQRFNPRRSSSRL
jgi:hypothetical protein